MKSIAELYLAYLEMALINIVLASLVFIAVSGWVYGGRGRTPAALATVTLALIILVTIDRRRLSSAYPEPTKKPFRALRLFWQKLHKKVLSLTGLLNSEPRKQALANNLSMLLAIIIAALAIGSLYFSFSISADISSVKKQAKAYNEVPLTRNQARVLVDVGEPATIFNNTLVIEVVQVTSGLSPKVTAVIRSDGGEEVRIEGQGIGYETTYGNRFLIRIIDVKDSAAKFFVERLENQPA